MRPTTVSSTYEAPHGLEHGEEEAFLNGQPYEDKDEQYAGIEYHTPSVKSQIRRGLASYLRITIEVFMAIVILMLVLTRDRPVGVKEESSNETLRRSPVPKLPRKLVKFTNDPHFAREDMFMNRTTTLHTLHNWIPLSSVSRGYVQIKNASSYDLPEPYTIAIDRFTDGPGYMTSTFHQLHCLSYLADHFQQGYGGVELTTEVAHHSAHCFNYIRQGINCAGDTTLEGKTGDGPGEGSVHECVDYEVLLKWANDHKAMEWRQGLIPGEAIL